MQNQFHANCHSVLIGSLPIKEHRAAIQLVAEYAAEIPLWVQLPIHKAERMIAQFLPGMPGLTDANGDSYIDTEGTLFDEALVAFYEEYLAVIEGKKDINNSRFILTRETAEGFYVFLDHIRTLSTEPIAVKGQVTGPVTFATGVSDRDKKAIFYNDQVRDAAVKLLSLKAAWQVKQLSRFNVPVILFIDEPALAGYGSSELATISREDVIACLDEVIDAVHAAGGLAGIHVCANTDWSVILESSVDIVNFDTYSYFDRFILYPDQIKKFILSGRILAWGIVPTSLPDDIERETTDSLVKKWKIQMKAIEALGIKKATIVTQSLITPSCGTGSLSPEHALKVLQLTQSVSRTLRKEL